MALIKEALKESSPDYKRFLYPEKESEYSKKVKPFTFSVAFPPGSTQKKERFLIDKEI